MPTSRRIVVARKPRRSRKPLPHKPEPACGAVVRVVRGKAIAKPVDPEAEERAPGGRGAPDGGPVTGNGGASDRNFGTTLARR